MTRRVAGFAERHEAVEPGGEALRFERFGEVMGPGFSRLVVTEDLAAGLLDVVFKVIKIEALVGQRDLLFPHLVFDPRTAIEQAQGFVDLFQFQS